MNILYGSPLCAGCIADMLRMPQHRQEILDWMGHRMATYSGHNWKFEEGKVSPADRPREYMLHISVNRRDLEHRPEGLYTKYFEWSIECRRAHEDGWGFGCTALEGEADPAPWEMVINGGMMNHGTFEEPDWLSHT